MDKKEIISLTISFVKETLDGAEGGHDWFHIERVYNNAKLIAKGESVDLFIVELGALLHDIADAKFHNGDETIGPKKAASFLKSLNIEEELINHIVNIIHHVSFKTSLDPNSANKFQSNELSVIQDADRLDAIGAIGIARAFNYGGFKNRSLYDPLIAPNIDQDKETYKNSTAPTINHFYEKLLLLKDKMNTITGRKIAEKRHRFMEQYLEQFYDEWNGKA
ncbi:MAG: HD domain-containing protein [Flavobacteriales bacterium]|nr:HD domain-containing protein [Flavobacteriales bacterium]